MNRSFDRYIKEEGEKLTDGYPRENVCRVSAFVTMRLINAILFVRKLVILIIRVEIKKKYLDNFSSFLLEKRM